MIHALRTIFGFNEAAALRPQKGCRPFARSRNGTSGFNEAAALRPQKGDNLALFFQGQISASMRLRH